MSKQIIILGMHRSGTSTLAMRLEKSGLHMGDQLLGAGMGNPLGHYEDKKILKLHNDILAFNQQDFRVTEKISWVFDQQHYDERNRIIAERNSKHSAWGWKEPRTCLFVDFWEEVLVDPLYLVVVREPSSVVQSLLSRDWNQALRFRSLNLPRRWKARFLMKRKRQKTANLYLRTYIHYNRCIIEDVLKRKRNYNVIPFEKIIQGKAIPHQEIQEFGIQLENPGEVAGARALKRRSFNLDLNSANLSQAEALFDQISSYAD